MIYIASPYTHADPLVMAERYQAALEFSAWLVKQRLVIYSPIVMFHEMAQTYDLPREAAFWFKQNATALAYCHSVYVLCIPGWAESKGVAQELAIARANSARIQYYRPIGYQQFTESAINADH